jgi:hypothetical protein
MPEEKTPEPVVYKLVRQNTESGKTEPRKRGRVPDGFVNGYLDEKGEFQAGAPKEQGKAVKSSVPKVRKAQASGEISKDCLSMAGAIEKKIASEVKTARQELAQELDTMLDKAVCRVRDRLREIIAEK